MYSVADSIEWKLGDPGRTRLERPGGEEADHCSRRHLDPVAGPGISRETGLSSHQLERSEPIDLDAAACHEEIGYTVEDPTGGAVGLWVTQFVCRHRGHRLGCFAGTPVFA